MPGYWRNVEYEARWVIDGKYTGDDWWNHAITAEITVKRQHPEPLLQPVTEAPTGGLVFFWDVRAEPYGHCAYGFQRHGRAKERKEAEVAAMTAIHQIADMRLHYAAEQERITGRMAPHAKEGEQDARAD